MTNIHLNLNLNGSSLKASNVNVLFVIADFFKFEEATSR